MSLDTAEADLAAAEATAVWARTRAARAAAPGLMYLATTPNADTYEVTREGILLGHLHHDPAESVLRGWTGHAGEDCGGEELGPHLTARQAANAVHQATR
jgi:hypothetical protein